MKIIHCSLWGDVEISEIALQIIDTPFFQRLHYVRQNGFAYKVFPTVTTSRFSHSIGVYHITKVLLTHISLVQPEKFMEIASKKELICIAGLIHDIGHGPFSHWFDQFLEKMGIHDEWSDHENRSIDIFKYMIRNYNIPILEPDVQFIIDIIQNKKRLWFFNIIKNQKIGIDTDKLDYLLRDCQSFGLPLKFDAMRIIKNTRIIENDICFCERIKNEIDNLFYIRNKMYNDIYYHKTIQKFDYAAKTLLDDKVILEIRDIILTKNVDKFLDLTDNYIFFKSNKKKLEDFDCRKWPTDAEFTYRQFHDSQIQLLRNINFYKRSIFKARPS